MNHNLANQNWNKMTGGSGGGGQLILGDRQASGMLRKKHVVYFNARRETT
jgi:hypothetical protein